MPLTATELVTVFNEVADTPEELKALLTRSNVKEGLRDKLKKFRERATTRLQQLQSAVSALETQFETAIAEAESGTDPTNVPTTADEDTALA